LPETASLTSSQQPGEPGTAPPRPLHARAGGSADQVLGGMLGIHAA